MRKKFMLILAFVSLTLIFLLSIDQPLSEPEKLSFFAFDTAITLTGYGPNCDPALDKIQSELFSIEDEMSRTLPGSSVYNLNHSDGKKVTISKDLMTVLQTSKEVYKITDGAFDITIAPAADLWGFTQNEIHLPTIEELTNISQKVGMDHLHLTQNSVRLDPGSMIDLGGIAKGFALDKTLTTFQKEDLKGGIANLGGDILAYGNNSNGSPWNIAIQDPLLDSGENIGILKASDQYILTSGGYERYFEAGGQKYQHIIDPFTCSPSKSSLTSATVITSSKGDSAMIADALATSFIIMGKDKAIEFWKESDLSFDMILIDDSGQVSITEGIQDHFDPKKDSTYRFCYLKK